MCDKDGEIYCKGKLEFIKCIHTTCTKPFLLQLAMGSSLDQKVLDLAKELELSP